MTPISFPDDDIYENGVVVSMQPDIYDEFSDQSTNSIIVDN